MGKMNEKTKRRIVFSVFIVVAVVAMYTFIVARLFLTGTGLGSFREDEDNVTAVMLRDPFLQRVFSQANWTAKTVTWTHQLTPWGLLREYLVEVELDRPVWVSGTFKTYSACCDTEPYRAKMWTKSFYVVIMGGRVEYIDPNWAFPPGDPPEPVPEITSDIIDIVAQRLGDKPLLIGVFYDDTYPSGTAWFVSPPRGGNYTVVIVDIAKKKIIRVQTVSKGRGE